MAWGITNVKTRLVRTYLVTLQVVHHAGELGVPARRHGDVVNRVNKLGDWGLRWNSQLCRFLFWLIKFTIVSPPWRITSVNPSLSEINMTPSPARQPEKNNPLTQRLLILFLVLLIHWMQTDISHFTRGCYGMMDGISEGQSVKESWPSAYFHWKSAHPSQIINLLWKVIHH